MHPSQLAVWWCRTSSSLLSVGLVVLPQCSHEVVGGGLLDRGRGLRGLKQQLAHLRGEEKTDQHT